MLTTEHMKIAVEVLEELSDVNFDLGGDHEVAGDYAIANKCFSDALLLRKAVTAVLKHQLNMEDM